LSSHEVPAIACAHESTADAVHPVPLAASVFIALAAVRVPHEVVSLHATST
jgi:hypothetical protein